MRARMLCTSITRNKNDQGEVTSLEVYFSAVTSSDPSHPNFVWAKATPLGNAYLKIENAAVFDHYKEGREYSFDIYPDAIGA